MVTRNETAVMRRIVAPFKGSELVRRCWIWPRHDGREAMPLANIRMSSGRRRALDLIDRSATYFPQSAAWPGCKFVCDDTIAIWTSADPADETLMAASLLFGHLLIRHGDQFTACLGRVTPQAKLES